MSYILEALKKSQQERDLGQVPTLETPTVLAEEKDSRPNRWILLAVLLAVLAVVIASYSALRGGTATPEPVHVLSSGNQAAASGQAGQDADVPMQSPSQPQEATEIAEKSPDPPSPLPSAGGSSVPKSSQPEIPDRVIIEKPRAVPQQSGSPAPGTPVAAKPETTPEPERDRKVPPDLVADIEAFKQKIRKEQSGATDTEQGGSTVAPQDLRLPKELRKRLPEFVLSAHIYDEEPSKRFVLINGLKIQEGEESREEIRVEQILPEGVVLSFDGHRFFQRRR